MPSLNIANVDAESPTLGIYQQGFVIGNDSQWQRVVSGLLFGDTLINAWLTIKTSPAMSDASGVQSPIGLAATGYGQIVGNACTFNVKAGDTLVLDAGPLYYYDIKVQCTPSGNIYTVEQGWISWLPEVGDKPVPNNASISLPPIIPAVLFGTNPPPNGTYVVGTRYWVVPPTPGFPSTWVYADDNAWHVESVVSQ